MELRTQQTPPAAARVTLLRFLALLLSFRLTGASTAPPSLPVLSSDATDTARGSGLPPMYEPEFSLFSRDVIGRAVPPNLRTLKNNEPFTTNLDAGKMNCYKVEKSMLFGTDQTEARNELRAIVPNDQITTEDTDVPLLARQATTTKTIYISANTCLQPRRASSADNTTSSPPQLWLSISTNGEDGCPDPSQNKPGVQSMSFDQGAAMLRADVDGDVYIGIQAPEITADFEDVYNYEIAVSVDTFFHNYDNSSAELLWMDSDANSVLLMTKSLTQDRNEITSIMKQAPPYELFIQNDRAPALEGMLHSVCGLTKFAQIAANRDGNGQQHDLIRSTMTTRGPGSMPKQQFYLEGLNASSAYTGVLVRLPSESVLSPRQDGSGIAGGRGTVFGTTAFQTLSGTNCQVVTDLEFCDEIQYAVPGNDLKFNNTELARAYDNKAREMYGHFERVMMQIPCETDSTSQYSLARNCTDCRTAYKRWLCTVSIPRCEAFDGNNKYSVVRNVGQAFPNQTMLSDEERRKWERIPGHNASRNSFIDQEIQPGPYRETLPCEDVCYQVVQSCPAAIGFQCPQPGMTGFDVSYGKRLDNVTAMTCNYPGESRTRIGAAESTRPRMYLLAAAALVAPLLFNVG
ncbi:Calcium influx-promoting protein ehs1 [Paramyrothecium foliicola]|nr:Calcium influx-promoting protein ehs1 [Paramyrothecium foliicola]